MILRGEEVARYIERFTKINPNSVDVAPKKIYRIPDDVVIYLEGGRRGFLKNDRFIPLKEGLIPVRDKGDRWILNEGTYYVVFPRVSVPVGIVGFAYPRSSLNRLGIIKSESAVFDPGYEGEWNQTFYFPRKAIIHKNEGWVQLVFFKAEGRETYKGFWQGERYK